jgi:hypothetical protein
MNEGEFDKLFNNKFEDFEGSDFSTTEWEGLENRLNQRDNKRRGLLWLFPVLLFTALAGGGVAIWYNSSRNDKQEFPQQQLINPQNPIIKTDTLRDTIIRRTIIYQNDTIS